MPYLTWFLAAGAVFLSAWAAVRAYRDQPVIFVQLKVAGVILSLLLITMITTGVQLYGGHQVQDPVLLWGYFITSLVLYPVAGVWSIAERTRWSSVVLLVAGIAFAIVMWRINELWVGA